MQKAEKQKRLEECALKETFPIYQGRIISVSQEKYHLTEETVAIIDKVSHPGAVAILPVDDKNRILCIRQWRRAAGTILIEIPAGTLEPGETPLFTAQRELQEEIGYRANILTPLGGFYTAPGFCTEYIHLFLAKDLVHDPLWADDTDYIDILPISLEELQTAAKKGEIIDSKTLSALYLYSLHLHKDSL
jgi:ADP-ribose pyrophosphatase